MNERRETTVPSTKWVNTAYKNRAMHTTMSDRGNLQCSTTFRYTYIFPFIYLVYLFSFLRSMFYYWSCCCCSCCSYRRFCYSGLYTMPCHAVLRTIPSLGSIIPAMVYGYSVLISCCLHYTTVEVRRYDRLK